MTFLKWTIKMIISLILDGIDFFMPPIIGTVYDFILGFVGLYLWGIKGGAQFLELIDITDRADAFIPTLTIMGLFSIKEIWEKPRLK
jgi:hypothetical protein